jgi:1-acyl-sn-glycerol-3-phosphate acyltransferase
MIRGIWVKIVMAFSTLTCGLAGAIITSLKPGSDATMVAGRLWSRINLWATGAQVEWRHVERASSNLPCIYVANHQSNIDIWALIAVLPKQTRFVAKQALFKIPVLGWALRVSDFVPIDRTNRKQAIRSLDLAAEKIRGGRPVVLFAEGTRTAGDELAPFKKGPFHLALAAQVPIIPVAISGSGKVMPPSGLRVKPGAVRVTFCEAVDVSGYKRSEAGKLLEEVRSVIERTQREQG